MGIEKKRSGHNTDKGLLREIGMENENKSGHGTFLLEPLISLSDSLTLSQTEGLHKCDLTTQLYLSSSSNLGIQEGIL